MIVLLLIIGAIGEVVNNDYLHWWQTTNGDIAAIVCLVGALVLMERKR